MRAQTPATRTFDVTDDESSQVYDGVQAEESGAVAAVEATGGEVCVWGGGGTEAMFCTYYSSCCGGLSQHVNNVKPRDPDVPPLAGGVACDDCRSARHYRWGPVTISKAEATKRLLARYPTLSKLGLITDVRPKELTKDGRIIRIELIGSGGQKETLMGEDFRLSLGGRIVKSTKCTIVAQGGNFIFKDGRGFGHGMGLCQYGMETKARRGMDHRQILTTYYPGATLKKIY
jgi:stage II sporulation protein D